MNWYYSVSGQQIGPVLESELSRLAVSGTLAPSTLVWREGMPDWQPLSVALPGIADAPEIGGLPVPAAQKDRYVQQMREGMASTAPGTMRFAGFWIRFVAKFIDLLIMWVANFVFGLMVGFVVRMGSSGGEPSVALPIVLMILNLGMNFAYSVIMVSKFQATVGKMAVGLKVVRADGTRVSARLAIGRYFAEMISGFTLAIGYIIAAFDAEKRALHDHICATRVIETR